MTPIERATEHLQAAHAYLEDLIGKYLSEGDVCLSDLEIHIYNLEAGMTLECIAHTDTGKHLPEGVLHGHRDGEWCCGIVPVTEDGEVTRA